MNSKLRLILSIILFFVSSHTSSAELQKIEIFGNDRIPSETIIMFSGISENKKINEINLNSILKNLYESNFFENVSVELIDKKLKINVEEYPIIENIIYEGFRAKKFVKQH